MAKPAITKRAVKAAALTYAELDTNFQNLADATLSLTGGSTAVTADLNGNITLVAGTGVTITGDNSAKTITISNASLGANAFGKIVVAGQSDVDADTTGDTLTLVAGSNVTLTTNSSTDTITIATAVSGLTNPLTADLTLGSYKIIDTNGEATIRSTQGLIVESNLYSANAKVTISPGSDDVAAIASIQAGNDRDLSISTTKSSGAQTVITLDSEGAAVHLFSSSNADFYTLIGSANGSGVVRLVPMTNTQRNARTYTANGMIIYNETTHKFQGYANGTWVDLH
jgi:hypothetical protein